MPPKNKKSSLTTFFFRTILIVAFLGFFGFFFCDRLLNVLQGSQFFIVKDIWYESSLKLIDKSELSNLKGKNLLTIDLKKVQQQLQARYPQYKQLRVLKKFPNQIVVAAYKRSIIAQVKFGNRMVPVDENAIFLAGGDIDLKDLPIVYGVNFPTGRLAVGVPVKSRDLLLAIDIIQKFQKDRILSNYRILRVDVSNLSEVYFYVAENLKVIIDQENLEHKLRILGLVLVQAKADLNNVKYVDLRFKEPILGKK